MVDIIHCSKTRKKLPIGYLTPTQFILVPRRHEKWAGEHVLEMNWLQEQNDWEDKHPWYCLAGEFLILKKGYILLHDPTDSNELFINYSEQRRMTRFQYDFLCDVLERIEDVDSLKKITEVYYEHV